MVNVLDPYYLAITALVTVGYQLLFFFFAAGLKVDTFTDFAGGSNFLVLALLTFFLRGTYYVRQVIATVFVCLWALRLAGARVGRRLAGTRQPPVASDPWRAAARRAGPWQPAGFLFWRILKMGHDKRFDDRRDNFWAFLVFWIFQMVWVWTVSLPVTVLNAYPWGGSAVDVPFGTATDIVGIVCFVLGLVIEAGPCAAPRRGARTSQPRLTQGRTLRRAQPTHRARTQSLTSKRRPSARTPPTRTSGVMPACGAGRVIPTMRVRHRTGGCGDRRPAALLCSAYPRSKQTLCPPPPNTHLSRAQAKCCCGLACSSFAASTSKRTQGRGTPSSAPCC